MSKEAEQMQQAIRTLRVTQGTPYQRNAENAPRELVRRLRGDLATPRSAVLARAAQDARHAENGAIPAAKHPWRAYPRNKQSGMASLELARVFTLLLVSLVSVAMLVGGLALLGYSLLSKAEAAEQVAKARVWREKRRALEREGAARKVEP